MELADVIRQLGNASWFAGEVLAFLVLIATIVTSITPSRANQEILDQLLQFLNILAGNVGRNRNADDL